MTGQRKYPISGPEHLVQRPIRLTEREWAALDALAAAAGLQRIEVLRIFIRAGLAMFQPVTDAGRLVAAARTWTEQNGQG